MKFPFTTGGSTRRAGALVEDHALRFLQQQGLKLLVRNYTCRAGEIDLVMRDSRELVFVEVRFRRHLKFGSSAESVDYRKQQKLIRTAQHFLQAQRPSPWPACRFDVIAAYLDVKRQSSLHFDWIKNAFDLQ